MAIAAAPPATPMPAAAPALRPEAFVDGGELVAAAPPVVRPVPVGSVVVKAA